MKKSSLYISLLTTVFCLSLQATEDKMAAASISDEKPHNVYFGKEWFCLDLHSSFEGVKISGSKCFSGVRLGYEYLNPNALYFGMNISSAVANDGFRESVDGTHFPQSSSLTGFANFELKAGYAVAYSKLLTTPFFCMGGYSLKGGLRRHSFEQGISYLGAGVRSRYDISNKFNVGLNFKIFGSTYREEKWKLFSIERVTHHGLWGGEVGAPFSWKIGSKKRWDIQLEPYFLKLSFAEAQNVYGTRLVFDYVF